MRSTVVVSVVLAAILALVAALPDAAAGLQPAAAGGGGPALLALGDSIAYGWSGLADARSPSNFIGYPDLVAQRLGLADVNAACPGEASGGFLSPTGVDNGCRPYRLRYPLHELYQGTQLEFAEGYLAANPRVRVVTIDLGANDVFVLQHGCAAAPRRAACVEAGLPAVLGAVSANLRTIFSEIRRRAGYGDRLVALTYYPLVSDTQRLNAAIAAAAQPFGVTLVSGPDAFASADRGAHGGACGAGLLIVERPGTCDIHPTPRGSRVLAEAVLRSVGMGEGMGEGIPALGPTAGS
jgi:lysophospholipase L1-like esterase